MIFVPYGWCALGSACAFLGQTTSRFRFRVTVVPIVWTTVLCVLVLWFWLTGIDFILCVN